MHPQGTEHAAPSSYKLLLYLSSMSMHPPSFLFCQIAGLDEKLGGHHLDDDDDDEVDPGVDESAPTPKVAGKKLPGGCKASRDRMRAGCD